MKKKFIELKAFAKVCLQHYRWLKSEARTRATYPKLGFDCFVKFRITGLDSLTVGNNFWIEPFSYVVVLDKTPETTVPGRLEIGDNVWIGARATLMAAGGSIVIGHNCLLAHNVSIIAALHGVNAKETYRNQPWRTDKTGVFLGSNIWVGAGVTILPGVRIGDNAVIGAGSVVTRDVPENEVWAGIPAVFLKKLSR